MRMKHHSNSLSGKIGYLLLWAIGVPLPVILIIYLFGGCH